MKKDLFGAGVGVLILGIILILTSPNFGAEMAGGYLRSTAGGSMDTNKYLLIMEGYIAALRAVGFLVSLLGGLCALAALAGQKNTTSSGPAGDDTASAKSE